MRKGPTVEKVQYAINARWSNENADEESRYVPPYGSCSIVVDDFKRRVEPTVKWTFVLGNEDDDNLEAFAIVDINGKMACYQVEEWTVMLLSQDATFAQKLAGSSIGDNFNGEVVVSINGDPIATYQEALEKRELRQQKVVEEREQARLQEQERQQQTREVNRITVSVRARGARLQQDERNLAQFPQLQQFSAALEQERLTQKKLWAKLNIAEQLLRHIDKLERALLEAEEHEEASLGPMRKEAVLLCKQEQEQKIVKLNAEKKIQHEQKLQQDKLLQQQQAARILEADKAVQKKQAAQLATEVKNRQQAIDKCAARYEQSLDAIEYKRAKLQLESIRHYIKEDADIYILRERIAHLHSRCEKSYPTTLSGTTSQPTQDYAGAKTGAVIGGLLGLAGGPLVAIAFASLGSVVGDLVAPNTKSSQSSSKQTPEQQKWASLIKEIDEIVQTLSEKKDQ